MVKEIVVQIKTSFDPSGFDSLKGSIANAQSIIGNSTAGMQTSLSQLGASAIVSGSEVDAATKMMSTGALSSSSAVADSAKNIEESNARVVLSFKMVRDEQGKFKSLKFPVSDVTNAFASLDKFGDSTQRNNAALKMMQGDLTKVSEADADFMIANLKVGDTIETLGKKSEISTMSVRHLGFGFASVIANGVQLADLLGRIGQKGQDTGKIMLLLAMNSIQFFSAGMMVVDALGKIRIGTDALTISELYHGKAMALSALYQELGFIGTMKYIGAKIAATTATWAHTASLAAESVALAITNALSGPWGWAILAGAIAMAAIGIGLAAGIPSKATGGYISQTGPYLLHAGEYVNPKGTSSINITVYSPSPELAGKAIIRALKDEGVV